MKIVFIVAAGAAIVGAILWYLDTSPRSAQPPVASGTLDVPELSARQADDRDTRLVAGELRRQRRAIARLEARIAELQAKGQSPRASDAGARSSKTTAAQAAQPFEPSRSAFDERHVAQLEDALKTDGWDDAWSSPMRDTLRGITSLASTSDTKVESLDCGSTFCRTRAVHESIQAREQFEERFRVAKAGYLSIRTTSDSGKLVTTTFLVRPESDSPDHPVRRIGSGEIDVGEN